MSHGWGVPAVGAWTQVVRVRTVPSQRIAWTAASGLLILLALSACADPAPLEDRAGSATLSGAMSQGSTSSVSPAPSDAMIDPGPVEDAAPTPIGGQPWDVDATAACELELAEQGMAVFQEIAQSSDSGGVTSFWTAGRRWVVCDGLEGEDSPTPALLESSPGATPSFDGEDARLSTTVVTDSRGEVTSVRFAAGGKLGWRVDGISYTFPDGHVENARFVASDDSSKDTWWAVSYTVTVGDLLDQEADPADVEPLLVSVDAGAAWAAAMPWEEVVCAQTNFTC